MKILHSEEMKQLTSLAKNEASLINLGFTKSIALGLLFLSNALNSFEESYLKPKYGNIITSFSSEYRILVIEILKNIDDDFKIDALKEVILPKVKRFTNKNVLKILKEI